MTEIFRNTRDFFEKGNVKVFHSGKSSDAVKAVKVGEKAWMQTLLRFMGSESLKKVKEEQ